MRSFEVENLQTQYNVLSYRIDVYSHEFKTAIEIDENGRSRRIIDYQIKRQKAIEQKLGCTFMKIDPGKEEFNIFRAINDINIVNIVIYYD